MPVGLPKQLSLTSLTSSGRLAQEMAGTIAGGYDDSDDESDWDRYSYGEAEPEVSHRSIQRRNKNNLQSAEVCLSSLLLSFDMLVKLIIPPSRDNPP